jgi:hypothetical protein
MVVLRGLAIQNVPRDFWHLTVPRYKSHKTRISASPSALRTAPYSYSRRGPLQINHTSHRWGWHIPQSYSKPTAYLVSAGYVVHVPALPLSNGSWESMITEVMKSMCCCTPWRSERRRKRVKLVELLTYVR